MENVDSWTSFIGRRQSFIPGDKAAREKAPGVSREVGEHSEATTCSWFPRLLAAHDFAILWASVANTIPACFWSMYNLVSHPDALQVVRQEIVDVLNLSSVEFSPDKDVSLSKDLLDKLLYLGEALDCSFAVSLPDGWTNSSFVLRECN